MAYRLLEHTADVGIEASADRLDGLFVECLAALTDCMTRVDRVGTAERRSVALEAPDLEQLLVDWLSEALFLYESEGLVLSEAELEVSSPEGGACRLTGEVRGEVLDPERHGLETLVKAVTYHQIEVCRRGERWRARVILDL